MCWILLRNQNYISIFSHFSAPSSIAVDEWWLKTAVVLFMLGLLIACFCCYRYGQSIEGVNWKDTKPGTPVTLTCPPANKGEMPLFFNVSHGCLHHWSLEDVAVILNVVFKFIILNSSFSTHCEIGLRWMPKKLVDEELNLDQVMAWCRQAISRYPSQYWPSSVSPCGVTTPQWVDSY